MSLLLSQICTQETYNGLDVFVYYQGNIVHGCGSCVFAEIKFRILEIANLELKFRFFSKNIVKIKI